MSASTTATVDVGEFYDDLGGLIEILGGNIHVGYWWNDDDHTPLLEAINRFTDLVGDKLDLRPGHHLLDVGCGAGVAAVRLGQRTDATVTGITNSEWQVTEARRRVNAAGLRGQVQIDYGDAAVLPYGDASFDAAMALESMVHAQDRGQWLREMFRVLRPGGRMVLTEFTEEIPLTKDETEALRAGALASPVSLIELIDVVRGSGFIVDEFVSCGNRVKRSYTAYFDRVAQRRADLVAAYGEERINNDERDMRTILPIYQEKIGYAIIAGRKPS